MQKYATRVYICDVLFSNLRMQLCVYRDESLSRFRFPFENTLSLGLVKQTPKFCSPAPANKNSGSLRGPVAGRGTRAVVCLSVDVSTMMQKFVLAEKEEGE